MVMRQVLNVEVVRVMLDFLDGGKAMPWESHRKEEKVCRRPPLTEFVLVIGVGSRDGATYNCAEFVFTGRLCA